MVTYRLYNEILRKMKWKLIYPYYRWAMWKSCDVFFIGYPKTGNTWLRYQLGLISKYSGPPGKPICLFDGWDWLGRCERIWKGPACHFTHYPLTWNSQIASDLTFENVVKPFQDRKIVLLVRHPLDTLVSAWYQETTRVTPPYKGSFIEFVSDPVFGLDKLIKFYNLWAVEARINNSILLVSYESQRLENKNTLNLILRFLGVNVSADIVSKSLDESSFENMQMVEKSGQGPIYRSSKQSIFASNPSAGDNGMHVRNGKINGYIDLLQDSERVWLERKIVNELDSTYGYFVVKLGKS